MFAFKGGKGHGAAGRAERGAAGGCFVDRGLCARDCGRGLRQDAGADAAVMDKCVEMRESAMCARSIVCYGEAVKLVKGSPAKAEDPEKADEAGAEDSGEKTDD